MFHTAPEMMMAQPYFAFCRENASFRGLGDPYVHNRPCRQRHRFDVPKEIAANSRWECQIDKRHWNYRIGSAPLFPKFV
jgi:hypothetical protein